MNTTQKTPKYRKTFTSLILLLSIQKEPNQNCQTTYHNFLPIIKVLKINLFKAPGKKYIKDFLRLNNSKIALRLLQSSGMKTARS